MKWALTVISWTFSCECTILVASLGNGAQIFLKIERLRAMLGGILVSDSLGIEYLPQKDVKSLLRT